MRRASQRLTIVITRSRARGVHGVDVSLSNGPAVTDTCAANSSSRSSELLRVASRGSRETSGIIGLRRSASAHLAELTPPREQPTGQADRWSKYGQCRHQYPPVMGSRTDRTTISGSRGR